MKIVVLAIFLILAMVSFRIEEPHFGIRYTMSPSLPFRCFISRPAADFEKHHYVALTHPRSQVLLAKQIIGVAGDTVTIREGRVYINNQPYGTILESSKSGDPLHPIEEGNIPENALFVYAPHQESFDSRYQEFGLVKKEQVKELLWPLF